MELTEEKFWDNYWSGCKLPDEIDMSFSFDRCLAKKLRELLPNDAGTVLEIGCAPGRWLVYLYKDLGLLPSGIEYSNTGIEATKKNFELLKVPYDRFYCGDFLNIIPDRQYDVVISLGFIEHFTDVNEVVRRHLLWLKPGGTLILGVPNFKGVYGPLQRILDKSLLEKHNLNIMNRAFFIKLVKEFNLDVRHVGYLGSFEPRLLMFKPGKLNILQFFIKVVLFISQKIRRLKFFDNANNRFISSYILSTYRRIPE